MANMAVTQEQFAAGENTNPTLLGMRQSPITADPMMKRRQVPEALVLPDDPLYLEKSEVCIKNTFLQPVEQLSPSLGGFYSERTVKTCPSQQIGTLSNWLQQESPDSRGSQELQKSQVSRESNVTQLASSGGATSPQTPPTPVTPPSTHCQDGSSDEHTIDECHINLFNSTSETLFSDESAPWLPGRIQQPQQVPASANSREGGSTAVADVGTWCFPLPVEDYGFPSAVMVGPLSTHPPHPEFGFADSDLKPTLNLSDMLSANQFLRASSEAMASPVPAAAAGFDFHLNPPPVYSPSGLHRQMKIGLLTVDTDDSPKPPTWSPNVSPTMALTGAEDTGSKKHHSGHCKPCAFQHTKGCTNGTDCPFCHICGPEELKKRRKQKLEQRRAAKRSIKTEKKLKKGSSNDLPPISNDWASSMPAAGGESLYTLADCMVGFERVV